MEVFAARCYSFNLLHMVYYNTVCQHFMLRLVECGVRGKHRQEV